MAKVIFEAVLGELTRNRVARAAHAGTVWTAALDHKAVDDAVEDQAIIEALLYEADEVVDGVRSDLRVELCLNAVAVFHGNGYDWILCHFSVSFLIHIYKLLSKHLLTCHPDYNFYKNGMQGRKRVALSGGYDRMVDKGLW